MAKGKEKLLIYAKQEELIEYAYKLIIKYPRSEKYTLAADIKKSMFDVLEAITMANSLFSNNEERLKYMNKIDAELDKQRVLVRLSHQIRCISNKNYIAWEKRITEVGVILGGWIKSTCLKG